MAEDLVDKFQYVVLIWNQQAFSYIFCKRIYNKIDTARYRRSNHKLHQTSVRHFLVTPWHIGDSRYWYNRRNNQKVHITDVIM